MSSKTQRVHHPRLACEIAADRVIAARAGVAGMPVGVYSTRDLPEGSLIPSLGSANVAYPEALRDAVAGALGDVAERSRDIVAIVPDAAVRVALLDFDTLPEKRPEADAVVRFRLKKSLPFDVEHAVVSYDVRRTNGSVKVVCAVSPRGVLDEYEALFREAGYIPGVVVPSMLAALGAVESDEPTLVLKVDADTTTLAIVDGDQLLLFRTLENPPAARLDATQLAEDVYPSLVFFEDNYALQVRRILVAGRASADHVGAALEAQTGAQVSDLVSASQTGNALQGSVPVSQLAGLVGALS